jgi:hypothetical protein
MAGVASRPQSVAAARKDELKKRDRWLGMKSPYMSDEEYHLPVAQE